MWSHIWLHIIMHVYCTKFVFEFCSIFWGILCCIFTPFNERGRVLPSVGECAWMWEGVPQCGRVCPSVRGCALVSVICVRVKCGCPCHMYLWRMHLGVHLIAECFSHVAKTYVTETSWNQLLLIYWFCYVCTYMPDFCILCEVYMLIKINSPVVTTQQWGSLQYLIYNIWHCKR